MANPQRGEVDLGAGAATYTLVLGFNAICVMQNRTKTTYGQLLLSLQTMDYVALREMLWQALSAKHAKQFQTIDQVGDLIDTIGVKPAIDAMNALFELNAAKGKPDGANPLNAQT